MSSPSDPALASRQENHSGVNRVRPRPKRLLDRNLPFRTAEPSQSGPVLLRKEASNPFPAETSSKNFRNFFRRNKVTPFTENPVGLSPNPTTTRLSSHILSSTPNCQLQSDPPAFAEEMVVADGGRGGHGRGNSIAGGPINAVIHRPSLAESARTASSASSKSNVSNIGLDEKPIASGNGVSISISLAEPALYLQGFDQADIASRATTMLRGTFHLKVLKSAKIKTISLNFRGRAETEWPEGDCFSAPLNRSLTECRDTSQEDRIQRSREHNESHMAIF